jgi:hypothetical protein
MEEIQVIARIKATSGKIEIIRSVEGDVIPSLLKDKKLEEVLKKMKPGEEAIIKGYISFYGTSHEDGQISHKPIFMIEAINPVSLELLGKDEQKRDIENYQTQLSQNEIYSPVTIPISTEAATAMTITATALLLQNLAATPNQPQGKQDLNSGVLLYSGLFATSIFLYQQISSSIKEKK